MIRMRLVKGRYTPVVTCDVCQRDIADGQGNAEWQVDAQGQPIETVYHTHKHCSPDLRRRLGSLNWQDLSLHLLFLVHNSKVDLQAAEQQAKDWSE